MALIGMVAMRAEGGPLDPPGPPGSTNTSVLLPGTPIAGPITISAPGHYYLTQDIRLTGAVSGIVITSDDVSLDLGRFTIDGDNTAGTYGIIVDRPFTNPFNVKMYNGLIRDFNFGIDAGGATVVRISDVFVLNSDRGITLGASSYLSNCVVVLGEETGVYVPGGESIISDCLIQSNRGVGVTLEGSNSVLESSSVQNNNRAGFDQWGDVYVSGQRNVVKNNTVGTSFHAIRLLNTLNVVIDNVCVRSGITDSTGAPNVNNKVTLQDHANSNCGT